MKKITGRGRKILSMILRGICVSAASLLLQACYGMPDAEEDMEIRAQVRASETGQPIFGIKVSVDVGTGYWDYTSRSGYFRIIDLPIRDSYKITLEDVDGPAHGGLFKGKTWTLKKDDIKNKTLYIDMDLDD